MRKLQASNQVVTINATLKKIASLTNRNKYKGRNLKDIYFEAVNSVDYLFLADIIQELSEVIEGETNLKGDINKVYDFMESWVETNSSDYASLFKEVAEELNVKSFFGKKMSEEELAKMMIDPLASFDINNLVKDTAKSVIGEVVTEEMKNQSVEVFEGYKG